MKKNLIAAFAIAGLALSLSQASRAADKETTVTGEGVCAKCELKETKTCQNAIRVENDGKKVTYYFAENQVSKDFHKNICKAPAKITATGTIKEVDGKQEFTASKLEVAK